MPEKRVEVKVADNFCDVVLDRVQLVARNRSQRIPEILNFDICRDSFVRPQTPIQTYRRVRRLKNHKTGTDMYVQYLPVPPWLEPVKITVVAGNSGGLERDELETICRQFRWTRLLTVELALDFSPVSGIDRSFVLRYGIFGKSTLIGPRRFDDLRYGTRHSATMVRAYGKSKRYRVEIELHSAWNRKFGIAHLHDLSRLPHLLCFRRLKFVKIDWDAVRVHLQRKGSSLSMLKDAQAHAHSLHGALSFLRTEMGLANVGRFLVPLPVNYGISQQLEDWGHRW